MSRAVAGCSVPPLDAQPRMRRGELLFERVVFAAYEKARAGAETAGQLEFLEAHGCDEIQGFYFGQPGPPGTIESRSEWIAGS